MEIPIFFRGCALILLLIALGLLAFYSRRARLTSEPIPQENAGWPGLTLTIVSLPLLTVLLLDVFSTRLLDRVHFASPLYLRIIGLVLAFLCIPLLWWAFRSIGKNIAAPSLDTSHELVTGGPYGRVRHPLYGGTLLFLFSLGLLFGDWIILGFSLAGLLIFRLLVIPEEEQSLLEMYGEEYEIYRARTKALLPWVR
jgi:protein-S-isoprenylcysteine O-methyltransferase Ste14